jgi:hypothetical protein
MILLACNALDAALTVCAIEFGDAVEANPVMALLLAKGTLPFVIVKHLLVSSGLLLLWSFRSRRAARIGVWAVVPLYPMIVWYELSRCCV